MKPKKLYELLKKKLATAQYERQMCEEIARDFTPLFELAFSKVIDNLPEDQKASINGFLKKQQPQEQKTNNPELKHSPSEETKKIYKKVATVTHPDKQLNKPEAEAQEMSKRFTDASSAMNEADYVKLYEIAEELGIKSGDPTPEEIGFLRGLLTEEEEKTKLFQQSFGWVWYHANTEEEKEVWIKRFLTTIINQS